MKNRNSFIFNLSRFLAIFYLITSIGCKDNAWDEHYEQLDARLEKNLLSELSEDTNYSKFVELLEETGYDKDLNTSQTFTVWAPNNTALSLVSNEVLMDSLLLRVFVGNHISNFSYNTNITEDPILVRMINDKYIEFLNSAGIVSFGGVEVIQKDVLTNNGILHKLNDFLLVSPNIWNYLNSNDSQFNKLMEFLTPFNTTVFDEENSVKTGTNSIGESVYDSVFVSSNSYFNTIGDLSSEESRYTFIGITDLVYSDLYDRFDDYYQDAVEDSIRYNTDNAIFSNLNFPLVDLEDLNGNVISTTTGNDVIVEASSVIENNTLSNGNLFVVDELNYEAKDIIYKPIRYEIENSDRREIGSLSDFTIQKAYHPFASGEFTNIVTLLANPFRSQSNNNFEIAFSNVLSADYTINLKFNSVGASQQTKLKFEFSYVDKDKNTVVHKIPSIVVSNLESGIIQIGDIYSIPVYINNELDNESYVKLKVFVDVRDAELLLYDRKFGIDYAELVPVE